MTFISYLKHSFSFAIPSSMNGGYESDSAFYRELLSKYYPKNGIISIGNMHEDKLNYSKDFFLVFRDYKRAAAKEIRKREVISE